MSNSLAAVCDTVRYWKVLEYSMVATHWYVGLPRGSASPLPLIRCGVQLQFVSNAWWSQTSANTPVSNAPLLPAAGSLRLQLCHLVASYAPPGESLAPSELSRGVQSVMIVIQNSDVTLVHAANGISGRSLMRVKARLADVRSTSSNSGYCAKEYTCSERTRTLVQRAIRSENHRR